MMQVDVPTTFATSLSCVPAPIASQCASNAPTGIGIPARNPNFSAQYGDSVPVILSEVSYCPASFARTPDSSGSNFTKNSSEGSPPRSACHSHLCPIAQMLRFALLGSVTPHNVAATMSQCSNALANSPRLSGLWRSQWSSFANPHSEEYTPPHHRIASNP